MAPARSLQLLHGVLPVLAVPLVAHCRRLAEGVFDEADLLRRTDELADFVAAACDQFNRDPKHVIALGFSNGANIAAAMLLKRPGCNVMMGNGDDPTKWKNNHMPGYDFNDEALTYGSAYWVSLVDQELNIRG